MCLNKPNENVFSFLNNVTRIHEENLFSCLKMKMVIWVSYNDDMNTRTTIKLSQDNSYLHFIQHQNGLMLPSVSKEKKMKIFGFYSSFITERRWNSKIKYIHETIK